MSKKIILILVLLLASFVYAEEDFSFIFQAEQDVTFRIPAFDSDNNILNSSTSCYFSLKDDSSNILISDSLMEYENSSKHFIHNISSGNLTSFGNYPTVVRCDDGTDLGFSTFSIYISPSGKLPSTGQGILYSVLLVVLTVFLILSIVGAFGLEEKNEYDVGGELIKVNFNKYYKLGLFFLSYLILIFISYVSYAISLQFLFLTFATTIFEFIHLILWYLLFPIFFLFVTTALLKFILDLKLENLTERNLKERKGGKKGW